MHETHPLRVFRLFESLPSSEAFNRVRLKANFIRLFPLKLRTGQAGISRLHHNRRLGTAPSATMLPESERRRRIRKSSLRAEEDAAVADRRAASVRAGGKLGERCVPFEARSA
jgi:hypothetical protein